MGDGMERSNVHLPVDAKKEVKRREGVTLAEACRLGVRITARGEAVVSAETQNDVARQCLATVRTELADLRETCSAFEPLVEDIDRIEQSVTHAIARSNHQRRQQVTKTVEETREDPRAVNPGAEVPQKDAAQRLLNDSGEMPTRMLKEGPSNPAVRNQADRCGMDADEFFEYVCTHHANTPTDSRDNESVSAWFEGARNSPHVDLDHEYGPRPAASDGGTQQ